MSILTQTVIAFHIGFILGAVITWMFVKAAFKKLIEEDFKNGGCKL